MILVEKRSENFFFTTKYSCRSETFKFWWPLITICRWSLSSCWWHSKAHIYTMINWYIVGYWKTERKFWIWYIFFVCCSSVAKKKKSWILVIRLFHLVFTVFSSFSSSPFPPRLLPSPSSCFFVQLKWLQKTRGKIETGKWKKEVKKMVYELCCCHACIKILLDEWKKTSSLIGG